MKKHGSKAFTIEYLDSAVEEDIPALPKTMKDRIRQAVETRLTADPIGLGKPLRYSFVGHRRVRVGDYRIVYRLDIDNHRVIVVLVKHRKDVYQE